MADAASITVCYFAALTDYTHCRKERVALPRDPVKIKDFLQYLMQQQPLLASDAARQTLATCLCAINLEYVDLAEDEEYLKTGDEVVLIPPVSGG